MAHENIMAALAVNNEGTLVATASDKGTLVRLFSAENGDLAHEVRRGSQPANISCIMFHPTLPLLACCSSRKSLHVFELSKALEKVYKEDSSSIPDQQDAKTSEIIDSKNKKSKFQFMKFVAKYFKSEWSQSRIKLDNSEKICAFDPKTNNLTVLTYERKCYTSEIPREGGQMKILKTVKY